MKTYLADILSGDDNLDRACKNIPPEACHEVRWNFTNNVANGAASKLAEQIAGPNLILPWLFQLLGAPAWMFAFLMPIKQTFSLLPQMVVAGHIRRLPRRKWVWVASGLLQACCLLLMIPVALWLPPLYAGLILLLLLLIFSTASGTASVAFQDVLGKTIDKGHRGKLLARRALIGGLLTTAAGLLINRIRSDQQSVTPLLILIALAALLWTLAALFFALIREAPGAVQGDRNAITEVRAGLNFYRGQPGFKKYVQARSLLLAVELATPFYVLLAAQLLQLKLHELGSLIIAIGAAQIISSPFWGRLADQTSQNVMAISALIGSGSALLALTLGLFPAPGLRYGGLIIVFILIGLAESGVRLGRKTYLVDATPAAERPTYTAFSNSLVGVLAMVSGISGLIVQWLGVTAMMIILAGIMLAGYWVCRKMPAAEQMLHQPEPEKTQGVP